MTCTYCDNAKLVSRVGHLLNDVKTIDLNDLESLVQQAHECDIHSKDDPSERFPITRQALRMFWMFRRNIEAIDVCVEVDQ